MIPELGHFALWIALGVSAVLGVMPMLGAGRNRADWMALARPSARLMFALVAFAFLCLAAAFVDNDFSVLYVASNSNRSLPLHYRVTAVWGGHEGSILLWLLMLTFWKLAVATFSRHLPDKVVSRILAVMGLLSFGFLSLTQTIFKSLARLSYRFGELWQPGGSKKQEYNQYDCNNFARPQSKHNQIPLKFDASAKKKVLIKSDQLHNTAKRPDIHNINTVAEYHEIASQTTKLF